MINPNVEKALRALEELNYEKADEALAVLQKEAESHVTDVKEKRRGLARLFNRPDPTNEETT